MSSGRTSPQWTVPFAHVHSPSTLVGSTVPVVHATDQRSAGSHGSILIHPVFTRRCEAEQRVGPRCFILNVS